MFDCYGNLWTCFVWSLRIWLILDQTFVVMNLCHEFLNLCVQVVNLCSFEYVNVWTCYVWTCCVNLSL
jgi:hypothetical protein